MNTKRVSDEEKYHFDTLGFLLIKNVLDDSEIEKMKKTFIKVKNNNDYNSIHLNKKEMIPDDVNHASRVFIDDHYVRLNHLDKLDDNFVSTQKEVRDDSDQIEYVYLHQQKLTDNPCKYY